MAFIETPRFPDALAFWMEGGRGFKTTKVETFGGNEYRNSPWRYGKGAWQVKGEALRSQHPGSSEYFIPLRNLMMACRMELSAFRFKDFRDFQDETYGVLGTTGVAVAATLAYQMFKNYSVSPGSYQQIIQKPVASTIKVYVNGVLKTLTTDYTIDGTTGMITFVSQPTVGQAITWTGEFDIPVRLDMDIPMLGPDSTGAMIDLSELRLKEVRNF